LEFELDDYRTGKIKQKRRNLSCVNEQGNYCNNYNYNSMKKKEKEKINIDKIKTENNISKTIEKPISVNSNNNYLISKLKKENENLRLKLTKYTNNNTNNNNYNNNKFKPIDNKVKQQKLENTVRITKKIYNNKQLITKSSNNFSNFANNTYTNNFYNSKDNKFKTNSNSSIYNNFNKNIYAHNITMTVNSFIGHNKKNIKNGLVKSLSVYRNTSKNKSKNKTKKIIYDKIRANYKKIQNKLSNNHISNYKEKKDDNILDNLNINNLYNSRMNTLNNNIHNNNMFSWKKKIENDNNNQNLNSANGNLFNTDRKKTEANASNSNSKERNTTNYILNNEFNLTWSRFPKKSIETSFDHYNIGQQQNKKIRLSSKNQKINNEYQINNTHNQLIAKDNSKNKYINNQLNNIINCNNEVNIIRKDITPQKIKINRRIINNNNKINKNNKNNKVNNGSNNISMKNIINIQHKNKYENNLIIQENKDIYTVNNIHDGDIYAHKKRNSAFGIERKNYFNFNNNDIDLKKNNLNDKYNVTINNINNCNYFSLIQTSIRPELKIMKKKINKNNY
jgi:hypothetical protein